MFPSRYFCVNNKVLTLKNRTEDLGQKRLNIHYMMHHWLYIILIDSLSLTLLSYSKALYINTKAVLHASPNDYFINVLRFQSPVCEANLPATFKRAWRWNKFIFYCIGVLQVAGKKKRKVIFDTASFTR